MSTRSKGVLLKLSEKEKEVYQNAAKFYGRTLSSYIRWSMQQMLPTGMRGELEPEPPAYPEVSKAPRF